MALENRNRVDMHVHSPMFQGQLNEKKQNNLIVWLLGRVENNDQKRVKNVKHIFCF